MLGCSAPAEGHSHSLQVGQCFAPVPAVSGPLLGEPAGPDAGSSCQPGQVEVSGAHMPFQYQAQVAQSGLDSSCVPLSRSPGADRCPGRSGDSAEDKGQLRLSLVPGGAFSAAVGQEHRCKSPLGQVHAGSSCKPGQVEVSGAHEPLQHQAQVAQPGLDSSCMPPSRSPGADRCPGRSGDSAEDKGQLRLSLVPGGAFSAAVGQEHRCESSLGQFHAGSSCQPGQVEVSGAHKQLQHQAQVAQSGLDSSCVSPSRSPGAGRCPGRSGGSAEGKGQLQLSFVPGCAFSAAFGQEHRCESPRCQFCAGSSCQPGQVEVSGAHMPFQYQAQVAQSGLDSSCVPPSRSPGTDRCPGRSGGSAEDKGQLRLSLVPGGAFSAAVGQEHRCESPRGQFHAGSSYQPGQVEVSGDTSRFSSRLSSPSQVWIPVACRSPGAQVQVGAQAGQVAVLRVRGSCSCLLCQGALSLLHAVRSTGARARSVKSMQEVCASQVRLRSQVHTGHCSFSAAVGQEHRCESPLGQFHAGSSCQPGQVEVSGAHQPLQHQAQLAQSGLDSRCVPQSRSPDAGRCPGRSGNCLWCQGALSLLHAVRSTGARARSVNSMQEVLASQVRLRSQAHTGHSSIRLRLPCQVWTRVAGRSPGPQLHVVAQAGQVAVQKGNGSCSIQVHQVACVAKPWFTT